MTKIHFATKAWKQGVAALGALAALALAPVPANADICGDFDDIADGLLGVYLDQFEDLIGTGLSEKTCDSMTQTFFKACTGAVKDAVKCWDRANATIPKAAKAACNEAAKNPSSCYDFYKEQDKNDQDDIDNQADFANGDCEDAAASFFDVCRFGFP